MEKKSNGFLKVVGILMIIFGGISIVMSAIAIPVAAAAAALAAEFGVGGGTFLVLASWLVLIGGVVQLIAGILGVANANKPEKAGICIIFGALVALISILGSILAVVGGGKFDIVSMLIGLAPAALFLIGAFQSKAKAGIAE